MNINKFQKVNQFLEYFNIKIGAQFLEIKKLIMKKLKLSKIFLFFILKEKKIQIAVMFAAKYRENIGFQISLSLKTLNNTMIYNGNHAVSQRLIIKIKFRQNNNNNKIKGYKKSYKIYK